MYIGTLPSVVNEGVIEGIKNIGSTIGEKVSRGLGKFGAYRGRNAGEDHAGMEMGISNDIFANYSDSYRQNYMDAYKSAYKARKKAIKDDIKQEDKDWNEFTKTKRYKNSPVARLNRAAKAFKKTY